MPVRNLIFDLGGVLLDIDYFRTRQAFIALGITDIDSYYHQSHSNPLFARLERGEIESAPFYEGLRQSTGLALSDTEIENAWNAMLLDFRESSIRYLQSLKGQYQLFLLSNTNQIHYEAFLNRHQHQFGHLRFDEHFDAAYYSHLIKKRKPHADAYLHIIDAHGLRLEETLFIDDTQKNIEGAQAVGMQTMWLPAGDLVEIALPKILSDT
jgi:putative hydrolase of the HAD superfamily